MLREFGVEVIDACEDNVDQRFARSGWLLRRCNAPFAAPVARWSGLLKNANCLGDSILTIGAVAGRVEIVRCWNRPGGGRDSVVVQPRMTSPSLQGAARRAEVQVAIGSLSRAGGRMKRRRLCAAAKARTLQFDEEALDLF